MPLRPYQIDVANAIQASITGQHGHTFTVMMARQMGKNELSAHLEAWLLVGHAQKGGTIVKAAPTYRPQIANSMLRLEACLRRPKLAALAEQLGGWKRSGHIVRLGEASVVFFSAEPGANVMGATASLLLEVDEAQHVDGEKFTRDFRPMASSTNATTVLYGTAWRSDTLLEEQKRRNQEEEAASGERRHFQFDWTAGAAVNPAYERFVASEIARRGRDHPLIRTQYFLEPIGSGGGFFSDEQRSLLRGTHPRQAEPVGPVDVVDALAQDDDPAPYYVAGVDVAGAAEAAPDILLRAASPRKDSTVVGIAEVSPSTDGSLPHARLVHLYWWTGRPLHEQCDRLIQLLRDVWHCQKIVVDASGLGADLAMRLQRACGRSVVEPFTFSAQSKSRLAFHLVTHVNAARLQMWAEPDGVPSAEAAEFWKEVELARAVVRSEGQLGFDVHEAQGHGDFVIMLALVAWAAREVRPAPGHAILPPVPWRASGGLR